MSGERFWVKKEGQLCGRSMEDNVCEGANYKVKQKTLFQFVLVLNKCH
jgi:hypothetical protein